MLRFILKRLIGGIISFWIFSMVLFFGVNSLLVGDFADTLALQYNREQRNALREQIGLNKSMPEQYLAWLGNLARGDLGQSFTAGGFGRPVDHLLLDVLPGTLLIFVSGAIAAFTLGQWLGQVTGWHNQRASSRAATTAAVLTYTAFPPWLAFLLTYLFVERFGLLPRRVEAGRFDSQLWHDSPVLFADVMWRMLFLLLLALAGGIALRWLLARSLRKRLPGWLQLIVTLLLLIIFWSLGPLAPYIWDVALVGSIPFLTFALLSFGDTMLVMQTTIADSKDEMYIKLARAKGASEQQIRRHHAARNALLPVLTRLVVNLPYLLTAIVVIEYATNWTGIGDLLFNAMYDQNTAVYMGVMVVVGIVTLVARLALDIGYMLLDPRIRFRGSI